MTILSGASSACTSSEFSCTAKPCTDSSSANSTRFCGLTKPRAGSLAVTMRTVSPASGSTSRCVRPGSSSGTVTLARAGSATLRTADSGCGGDGETSAACTTQEVPSPVTPTSCGRLRRTRTACPRGSAICSASRTLAPPSRAIWLTSSGISESNTIHSASARVKTAAGVACAKGIVSRSPSLLRRAVIAVESPVICGAAFVSAPASAIFSAAGSGLFSDAASTFVSARCAGCGAAGAGDCEGAVCEGAA